MRHTARASLTIPAAMHCSAVTLLWLAVASSLLGQTPAVQTAPETANPQTAAAPAVGTQPAPPEGQALTGLGVAGSQGAPAAAAQQPNSPNSQSTAVTMILPNAKDLALAKRAFAAGARFKKNGKLDAAFDEFERASQLNPRSPEYLTAREFTRQQLVMEALERGNQAMLAHNEIVAMGEFRRAVEYDPTNEFALQRLRDSLPERSQVHLEGLRITEQSAPIELQPNAAHRDFHYRGDARGLLTTVAEAYGLTAILDDSVASRRVRFNIEDVDFATAMQAAAEVTKTFRVPLSAKQVLIAGDTPENRRALERLSQRTFFIPEATDQQLTEMMNSLRILLNIRFISLLRTQSSILVRAPQPVLEAASRVVESLSFGRPEVLLDMRVYQISSSLLRQIGPTWATQFTMFNISPSLIAGLGQNAQNLINQLISSGGINQANSEAIQALLAQLQGQGQSSILNQPFATFGGGVTLFGLTPNGPIVSPQLSLHESDVRSLEHVTLRASQNNEATLHIGERYPIVNATFAPIYNTPQIAQVLGNQSYLAPFPSFQFEDLGINLKATPSIHADRDVTLKLEMQVRSLGEQTVNGIPIINNREYSGTVSLKNGESGVVAGLISLADSRSISGYPFLSRVPGLSYAASQHNKNASEDELMIVITPHIIRAQEQLPLATTLPSGE